MVERDAVAPYVTPDGARNGARRFTALDTGGDRRAVREAGMIIIDYLPAQGGGISILQRDILGMSRLGCGYALGRAGLVVASRRIIDTEGKSTRMRNPQGEAAVRRDGRLDGPGRRIGGDPHLGILTGGNGPPRCGIVLGDRLPGGGGYLAADDGGVGFGFGGGNGLAGLNGVAGLTRIAAAGGRAGGKQCRHGQQE